MLILVAVALFTGATATLRPTNGIQGSLFSRDTLGLVNIKGFISSSQKVTDWIRTLRNDASIKGVLVRIDSPGGAVAPSQEMYMALKRLSAVKPVVVSMGSVAASGGYYIAVGADKIVANPATLTGSIGVKMELANMQGLMDKLGVTHNALTSGDLKNAGSPFQPMTEKERAYLQNIIMDMYEQFVSAIAEGRNMSVEDVKKVADGRAITGRAAKELGLVDKLGDMETATKLLLSLCDSKKELPFKEGPQEEKSFLRELLSAAISLDPASELRQANVRFVYY